MSLVPYKGVCPTCRHDHDSVSRIFESNAEKQQTIEHQQAEIERLKVKCAAWKEIAEYQYGRYRVARYGSFDCDYPVTGALDAWAANRHEVLKHD